MMRWVADSDPCPYCRRMDGKTVNMSDPFASDNDSFEVEGHTPLKLTHKVLHPPLHKGCTCSMMPGR